MHIEKIHNLLETTCIQKFQQDIEMVGVEKGE